MKRTLIVLAVLCFIELVYSQSTPEWHWATQAGGGLWDYGRSIVSDNLGNSYVTGSFQGNATFGEVSFTNEPYNEIYVAKLDSSGNYLWVRRAGRSASSDEGYGIALDSQSNVYVTGKFTGTSSFGAITLTASGKGDIFVAKLDHNGNWLWAVKAGGSNSSNSDFGYSIAVDTSDNVVVTGCFWGTSPFGSYSITSSGGYDIFIAKLDTIGNWLWAKKAGCSSSLYDDCGKGVAVDNTGNIYITGYFYGVASFGVTTLDNYGDTDVFIAKLDGNGSWLWAQQAGGTGWDYGYGISVDSSANIHFIARFTGTGTFGQFSVTSYGAADVLVANISSSGSWQWASRGGGTDSDNGMAIANDSAGNSYVTGYFSGSATFGTTQLISYGEEEIFIAKLDINGNWLWAISEGWVDEDYSFGIDVDGTNNIYLTGNYLGETYLGATLLSNIGTMDIWVGKLAIPISEYTISGYILDNHNDPLSGVSISSTGLSSTQSCPDGSYQLIIPSGWSGTIQVSHPGWVFNPTSRTFSNVTSNKVNNNFMGRLAQPVFTPPGDTYSASQNVTLQSQATGNVKYRYSFSSTPSYNSGSVYYDGFPIVVQNNTSINAVAYIEGRPGSVSDIATSTYAIEQEQDSRIRFRIDYSALPNGDVSFVDLVAKGLPSRFARSQVSSNQVDFTLFNLTASLFSFIGTSETSNLILRNSQLEEIGHVPFYYTQLDWLAGKRIDGVLVVHGQHTPAGEGWNYYNNDERMVSMLIKPTNLNASRKPMILVHGINGTYPYFDKDFINKLDGNPNTTTDDIFDIWQFYYPNDQQIEISGKLLGDAIQRVQSYGYNARVNIVAHSMGGLVTRSLIQSSDYQQNIRKFLMLGTPNHGSHSTFRLSHHRDYPASTLVNSIFVGTDSESPAVKQLYPGSAFLTALNSQVPNELYPGAPQANTYLVVAGTTNEADWLSSSREILSPSSMDDMVVSLPSASLLDGGIPLATVPVNHLGLCGNTPKDIPFLFRKMNPAYLYSFFSDSYQANGNPFGGSVTNYWSSTPIASQQASNTSVQFGAVLDSDCIDVERTGMTLKLKFTDYESSINAINRRIKNRLIRSEFSDDSNKSYYFMEQIKTTLGIATGSGLTGDFPPGNYTLRLQNRNSKTFKSVQNFLPVNNAISSSIYISLTPGEKAIANLTNSTVYSQSNKLRDGLNRTLTEEQYYIDASIDSLVFYIGGAEGIIGFADHNAHLIDPENTIIDQNYASVSPEVDFSEDIEAGFAYYYVRNPMPGLWKLRYSDSLPDTLSATMIDSPISLSALVEDTMFAIGDTISVQLPLPKPVTYVNPHISISLNYLDMNLITHALGNLEASYNSADSLYQCSFVPEFPGDYKLSINFQCSLDGSDVRRSIEKVIPVLAHKIPHVIAPLAGEGNLPTNLTLQWNSSILTQSYQLKLFSVSDSLAIVSATVIDTFYVVSNLEYGKEYYWYVSAVNGYGTSQTSSPSNFFTKLPQPILQAPENSAIDLPQTVDLSWEPVPGALYYHLQFSDDPLFGYCYINDSLVVSNGFELNGLSNLQTYYWRVAAVDERGTSDWSDPRSFTVRNYMISFPQTVQMRENEALTLYLANYIDNYSPGQYEITVSGATNLTAIVSYDRIVITPLENWFGSEDLLLTVNDISRVLFKNNSSSRTVVYQQTISVVVTELNSLPTLTMGENLLFWNSEDKTLDLTPYLSDPDNPVNEIQITGIASAHIGVSCIGQSISFLPQPGWFGQELIEIQLSNTIPRSMVTSHTKVSSERTENSCTSFYVLVNIVDAIPKISECTFYNGEIHLGWKKIIGADSYQIFSSTSVYGGFQDVTNTGTLFVQDGYIKWQQPFSTHQKFYYVKAVKSESRINNRPLILNRKA